MVTDGFVKSPSLVIARPRSLHFLLTLIFFSSKILNSWRALEMLESSPNVCFHCREIAVE
jgi:hypothetical protein